MKAGLFSPYLETMGGGERYFVTTAEFFLKQGYQVDLFWKKETDTAKIYDRFGIDIKGVNFVPDLFSNNENRLGRYLATTKYDVLFFLSDGSLPISFAKKTIIHFQVPFTQVKRNLLTHLKLRNAVVICNSMFTKKHIDVSYGINSEVIYPPVDVENFLPGNKENIILGVGRFFAPLHPKKQEVMVEVFKKLKKVGWKLVLIGGVTGVESQKLVENLKSLAKGMDVEIITDSSLPLLRDYYGKAKIFWHAAGFGEDLNSHPERAEHFGMTTVEAMSAGCVPIVYSGGGQREIVENGSNGYLWTDVDELINYTTRLIDDDKLRESLVRMATLRAKLYSKENFFKAMDKIV